jgi:hypothetical protein
VALTPGAGVVEALETAEVDADLVFDGVDGERDAGAVGDGAATGVEELAVGDVFFGAVPVVGAAEDLKIEQFPRDDEHGHRNKEEQDLQAMGKHELHRSS